MFHLFQPDHSDAKKEIIKMKLLEMAEKLIVKNEEKLYADRLENTHKRVREARYMRKDARIEINFAKGMKSLAESIINGTAVKLKKVKTAVHVRTLRAILNQTRNRAIKFNREIYISPVRKPLFDDIENAQFDFPYLTSDEIENLSVGCSLGHPHTLNETNKYFSELKPNSNGGYCFRTIKEVKEVKKHLAAIRKYNKGAKWDTKIHVPLYVEDNIKDYITLDSIGVHCVEDLRDVLSEYINHLPSTILREDPIKTAEKNLIGGKIPGFFPTPPAVIERMLDCALIEPDMDVLEPSAGTGSIVDEIVKITKNVDVLEVNYTLSEILKMKKHNIIGDDFINTNIDKKYDRVIMNPPFERLQDIDHVKRGYDCLKPGGVLVAIMSPGAFFREDKKCVEFREWFGSIKSDHQELPAGSFKESGTMVNSEIIYIEKNS